MDYPQVLVFRSWNAGRAGALSYWNQLMILQLTARREGGVTDSQPQVVEELLLYSPSVSCWTPRGVLCCTTGTGYLRMYSRTIRIAPDPPFEYTLAGGTPNCVAVRPAGPRWCCWTDSTATLGRCMVILTNAFTWRESE